MSLNLYIKNNNLHHAYCILGDKKDVMNKLEKLFLKEFNFSIINNPDFWYGEFDIIKIKDGRFINDLHQNRPINGNKKIFIVSANFITEDAQNSMLKLFEEPKGNTHFFLIIPSLNNIIPTFKSRLFIINWLRPQIYADFTPIAQQNWLRGTAQTNAEKIQININNKNNTSLINSQQFLEMCIGEKMNFVKKMLENISDEKESKMEIIKFINSLEIEMRKKINFLKINKKEAELFEEIEKIRQYTSEQSPSLKILLEYLVLIISKDADKRG
ncbi:MAG: hypothetical protein V1910_03000 [bacterium]